MIKYNPKLWFVHIFNFHKNDTINILWKELCFMAMLSFALTYIEIHYLKHFDFFENLISVYSIVGFVLSLLLVFRTNTAYDRWWEGRKKWGELVNNSRNLAIKVKSYGLNEERNDIFVRLISNYAIALKNHLRGLKSTDHYELKNDEGLDIMELGHHPNYFAIQLALEIRSLKSNNFISEEEQLALNDHLNALTDITGACERIANTPIPYSYSLFLKKFIFLYVTTLPLGFVSNFGYWTIAIAVFIFYILVSMEILAEEIEDPFGTDANDLPTDELSEKIGANVAKILRTKNR